MKMLKTLLATATLMVISSFLNGCGQKQPENMHQAAPQPAPIVKLAEKVTGQVDLELRASRQQNQLIVDIAVANPDQKEIRSVQSWLAFDPSILKGLEVDDENSDFQLPAPYQQEADNNAGLVKIGRATTEPTSATNLHVATVTFEIMKNRTTMIDLYDYREDLSGHVSVNVIADGAPFNIVSKPDTPALIIQSQ